MKVQKMGGVCGTSPTDMDGKASKSAPDERYIIYQLLYYEEVKLKSGCVTSSTPTSQELSSAIFQSCEFVIDQ